MHLINASNRAPCPVAGSGKAAVRLAEISKSPLTLKYSGNYPEFETTGGLVSGLPFQSWDRPIQIIGYPMSSIFKPVQNETTNTTQHVKATLATSPLIFGRQRNRFLLELEAWMPSEIEAISPMVEQLMRYMQAWRFIVGNEFAVELAFREALNNAVIHGNGRDPDKMVEVRCLCERGKGLWLTIKDQGNGFDPTDVPNPLAPERLEAEHGRGIYLLNLLMDEVSFERGGSEVRMRKGPARRAPAELPTKIISAEKR